MSDEVTKEVINQFLPQRKRKPRVSKAPGSKQNPAKVIKLEPQASGSEQTITEITNIAETSNEELIADNKEQVTEMIESIEEQAEQSTTEVKVKGEGKASKEKSSSKIRVPSFIKTRD